MFLAHLEQNQFAALNLSSNWKQQELVPQRLKMAVFQPFKSLKHPK